MSQIVIRAAVETDKLDIELCARKAYEKYVVRMDREPAPMNADFTIQISKGYAEVAVSQSQLLGYVVSYPVDEKYVLESVAVLPEYSGRGIGRLLIEHVEKSAIKNGYSALYLYTNEVMIENIAMYSKLGYIEVDRKKDSGFNRVFFNKQL